MLTFLAVHGLTRTHDGSCLDAVQKISLEACQMLMLGVDCLSHTNRSFTCSNSI